MLRRRIMQDFGVWCIMMLCATWEYQSGSVDMASCVEATMKAFYSAWTSTLEVHVIELDAGGKNCPRSSQLDRGSSSTNLWPPSVRRHDDSVASVDAKYPRYSVGAQTHDWLRTGVPGCESCQ